MSEPSKGTVDIEEGRRLLAEMTPAPWNCDEQMPIQVEREGRLIGCPLTTEAGLPLYVAATSGDPGAVDAAGIVWLRNNASALLARIEELETKLWIAAQVVRADGNIRDAALERAEAAEAQCIAFRDLMQRLVTAYYPTNPLLKSNERLEVLMPLARALLVEEKDND